MVSRKRNWRFVALIFLGLCLPASALADTGASVTLSVRNSDITEVM